jgi:hypothetical protein
MKDELNTVMDPETVFITAKAISTTAVLVDTNFDFNRDIVIGSTYNAEERDAATNAYWAGLTRKKYFPMEFSQLDALFNKPGSEGILLYVTNIDDPIRVNIEFSSYSSDMVLNDISENTRHFIFLKRYYDSYQISNGKWFMGGPKDCHMIDFLVFMIGKERKGNGWGYSVFINGVTVGNESYTETQLKNMSKDELVELVEYRGLVNYGNADTTKTFMSGSGTGGIRIPPPPGS